MIDENLPVRVAVILMCACLGCSLSGPGWLVAVLAFLGMNYSLVMLLIGTLKEV